VEAVPESTLHLEASADLRAWTRLGNRVVTEPVFTWTTGTAELPAPRFFRLVDDGAGE
jgi:hypothetical protein